MNPPDPRVSVHVLRAAAAGAVKSASLRSVAESIGMSAPGLQHFLDGGQPFPKTLRKLVAWYVRDAAARRHWSEDTARAALDVLLDGLPARARARVERELVEMLQEIYRENGMEPPWTHGLGEADPVPSSGI